MLSYYDSYYEAVEGLPDAKRGKFACAILDYYFRDTEPNLPDDLKRLFVLCKPTLDKSKVRSDAGSKTKSNENQNDNKQQSNENQTHQDNTPSPSPIPKEGKGGAGEEGGYTVAFIDFWETYPRKVGKKAALRAWKSAKNKPQIVDILKAVEQAKRSDQWQKDDGQYIPNPATWLNQGRWDDEHTTTTGPRLQEAELVRDAGGMKAGDRLNVEVLENGMCRATFPEEEPMTCVFDRFFKAVK